jgi:transcription elongation factor GreA
LKELAWTSGEMDRRPEELTYLDAHDALYQPALWAERAWPLRKAALKHAVIVEKGDGGSRVQIGSMVQVTNLGSGASVRYTIVGANEGNAAAGKISNASPIGRALLDRTEGEEVEVSVPAGVLRLRIEKVEG